MLVAYGIPCAQSTLVQTETEAQVAARSIGYPVALKACSSDLPHKTEAGVVRLGISTASEVRRAFQEIMAAAARLPQRPTLEGMLIQEMVVGTELIAGISRDPDFGPVVLVGLGGIFAEVLRDTSIRIAPITEEDARQMLQELKGRALIEGTRGFPPLNIAAVVEILQRLGQLAIAEQDWIGSVDVNPLIVSPQRAVAVDALIVQRDAVVTADDGA